MKNFVLSLCMLFAVFVGNLHAQTCPVDSVHTLTYINNQNEFAFIDSLAVDGLVVTDNSGVDSANSYQRFVNPIIQFQQGAVHTLAVAGPCNVQTSVAVFVDINQDHYFDINTELMANFHDYASSNGLSELYVNLPINIVSDTFDLRIVKITDAANAGISTMCDFNIFTGGEVEDYKVFVNCDAVPAPSYDPFPMEQCQGNNVYLYGESVGGQLYWYTDTTVAPVYVGDNYYFYSIAAETTFYIQNNVGGCTSPFYQITIPVLPAPVATILSTDTVISCTPVTFTAAPGAYTGYMWSTGDDVDTTRVTNYNGLLTLGVMDEMGCWGYDTIFAHIVGAPLATYASAYFDFDFCTSHTGALYYDSLLNPGTVSWYNAQTSQLISTNSSVPYVFATPGNYNFTAVVDAMCGSGTIPVSITVDSLPSFDSVYIQGSVIAANGNFTLCAATSQHQAYPVNLHGYVNYWELIDITAGFSFAYGNAMDTINLPSNLLSTANTYGIVMHMLNAQNCPAVSDTLKGNASTPGLNLPATSYACSFPKTLGGILDYSVFDFTWSTGDTTSFIVVNAPGNYSVTVTDDVYGCTSEANVVVQDVSYESDVTPDTLFSCSNQLEVFFDGQVDQTELYSDSWSLLMVDNAPFVYMQYQGFDMWLIVQGQSLHGCQYVDTSFVSFTGNNFTFSLGPDVQTSNSIYTIQAPYYSFYGYTWMPSGQNAPSLQVSASGTYSLTINNGQGCEYTDEINISFITGIKEVDETVVDVYPNPAKDIITIKQNEFKNANYLLYDMNGKNVLSVNGTNTQSINVAALPAGIYNLLIVSDNKIARKKIVIAK